MKKRIVKLFFLSIFLMPLFCKAQVINTITGNGISGVSGDNGFALLAQMHYPNYICTDKYNNVYITQTFDNRIRKIDANTGIITTYVGTGTPGYSGDNALATNAQVNWPYGICVDTIGNLFFADANNNRIRKVDFATGIIITVAGNGNPAFIDNISAVNASLSGPLSVIIDKYGNLLIADGNNDRVRKVDMSTGIITTIAGTGVPGYSGDNGLALLAQFNTPMELALDSFQNLYVLDYVNNRVRKINHTTSIITTIAGNGSTGFSGDGVLASNASLYQPRGLASDSLGNIFIGDSHNHRIRKVDASTGIITTIVGTGISGFSGDLGFAINAKINDPYGVKLDKCNNLLIADDVNNRIRKVWIGTTNIPSASIAISPNDTVCASKTVTFTTTPTNAGTSPTYHWLKNGTIVAGATSSTYSYTPNNGDSVQCIVVSSVPCAGPALSNAIHMTVTPTVTPSINISAPSSSILGNTVTVTATVANAGSNYTIHWMNHGIEFASTNVPPSSGNSATYTKGAGTDSITAKVVVTGVTCADSATTNTYITVTATENIDNVVKDNIQVYPNPANNILHIDNVKNKVKYRLLNIVGQCVQVDTFLQVNNIILLQGIPTGMYLLELTDNEGIREVIRVNKN